MRREAKQRLFLFTALAAFAGAGANITVFILSMHLDLLAKFVLLGVVGAIISVCALFVDSPIPDDNILPPKNRIEQ